MKGFVVLRNFFSENFVEHISGKISENIAKPTDKYQSGFNRIKFDLFDNDQAVDKLITSNQFRKFMTSISGRTLLYSQCLAFELQKKKSRGFPWHIGTQSFGYHRAEDFGCTIWAPLAPVKKFGQRGGMAYVPKNIVSGMFCYEDVDPAVFALTKSKSSQNAITLEQFVSLRDGPLNDPSMATLLDHFSVEDDFDVGDAIIFDKYVIHKSVMLEEGPMESRSAFVMRFVDSTSRYDKQRALSLELPRQHFGYDGPTRLHLDICKEDGALLKSSPFFHDRINKITLSCEDG